MAYADKCTTMRRMALHYPTGGNIAWEGVNIEGTCVLKEVSFRGQTVMCIPETELDEFLSSNESWDGCRLVVKYQDKRKTQWVPRDET